MESLSSLWQSVLPQLVFPLLRREHPQPGLHHTCAVDSDTVQHQEDGFSPSPNPHLGPPETTVKRSWAVQSIYFGRQTSAAIISSVIIKLNNSGQSLKMTTGDFKQGCARPIQFFCLLHISKSLLSSVQIKSMLYVKYSHSLFCLKLCNIVCFPGSEEKRVSSTHYLDWKHYKVTMGLMPW